MQSINVKALEPEILWKNTIDERPRFMLSYSKSLNALTENRLRTGGTESRRLVRAGLRVGVRLVPEQDLPKPWASSGSRPAPLQAMDLSESERARLGGESGWYHDSHYCP